MTTVPPPTTPTVLCACAATGAARAPAIAAMANILFRMTNSFCEMARPQLPAQQASQCVAYRNVPGIHGLIRGISGELLWGRNPLRWLGVFCCGTAPAGRLLSSISIRYSIKSAGDISNDHHRRARSRHRGPDCGNSDPADAAVAQFHCGDLPDLRRPGRSWRAQDVPPLALESGVSRLARNPPKWCKARIISPFK